uniref:Uncharacterized protein n=1 Tax=Oryza barthii TaxID=65489 RepID=A0A0D3FVW9_9ORYZ
MPARKRNIRCGAREARKGAREPFSSCVCKRVKTVIGKKKSLLESGLHRLPSQGPANMNPRRQGLRRRPNLTSQGSQLSRKGRMTRLRRSSMKPLEWKLGHN